MTINFSGSQIPFDRLGMIAGLLAGHTFLVEFFPLGPVCCTKLQPMQGGKRRAILQVAADRA